MDWAQLAKNALPGLGKLIGQGYGAFGSDWKNPADEALKTMGNIPDQMKQYYQPYMQAGTQALPQLQQQYGNLLNDPGAFLNQIGKGYQKSPGFDFALKQALEGQQHAASAGGMAGSPQHVEQNMDLATNLANKDFNNWISQALGLYGQGLSGEQGLYNTGASTSTQYGNNLADIMAKQAQLQYAQQANKNEREAGKGEFWGGLGDFVGNLFGGGGGSSGGGIADIASKIGGLIPMFM